MTPLVLLPGMMCDARLFGPQITALGKDRDILVPSIGDFKTVFDLAQSVLKEAAGRFALAGLSMGGIVAMEILRQAPERVERLALLDTNPLAEAEEVKARRGPQIAQARAGNLAAVMRDEMKPNYLVDSPEKPALLDLCMKMAVDLGPAVFVRQSIALRDRPDQCETLSQSNVPTLILCGRHDRLCPVERHELMADLIPHSHLSIIENAGHLPTLEQSDETTVALSKWLSA